MTITGPDGHTDFGALQEALSERDRPLDYYIFDLLELNGEDLRDLPLIERKERLEALLGFAAKNGLLRYSSHVVGSGDKVFAEACKLQLEGIVSKRADAPYRSGRGTAWLKCKCAMEQEFVIIGWLPSDKPGRPFASILIATRDNGELRYCGGVGSGYSGQRLKDLATAFKRLERRGSPAQGVPREVARNARFIEPELVAEIEFRGWTRDGMVRQGAFKGLRGDKPASEVVRERAMPTRQALGEVKAAKTLRKTGETRLASNNSAGRSDDPDEFHGVRVTHPDRELFAGEGITKRDVIAYYLSVADLMLPHLANRPTSVLRCPDGTAGACFFQKHASAGFPEEFKSVRISEKAGTRQYLYIEDERGLVAAVQMGVLELHIWGCHVDNVEQPDRLVFDFDPDEDLPFAAVRDAAREMRDRLRELGIESFAMATGGKGIHVVAPLAPRHSWDDHRDFAEALARAMAADSPDRFIATMAKAKRHGKIFIDYLRNTRGATAIAPFSTRARKGAPVAMPVGWTQLSRLQNAHPATVGDARRFARQGAWEGYFEIRQTLPLAKLRKREK